MNKGAFLDALEGELTKRRLSADEVRAAREYYADAIDERMDDGLSEQEATACMGSPVTCAQAAASETAPVPHLVRRFATRFALVNLVLAILTLPVWGMFVIAFLMVVASAYVTLFSLLLCTWIFFGCGILLGVASVVTFFSSLHAGVPFSGVFVLGVGMLSTGTALLLLPLVVWATQALVETIRLLGLRIVGLFRRGGQSDAAESRPRTRLHAPRWPKELFSSGLGFVGLGALSTLTALVSCGFDISTLPGVPVQQLGRLTVNLNGLLHLGDSILINL